MNRCDIGLELLLDYREGRTDADTSQRVSRHLASGCPECQHNLAWLGRVLPAIHEAEHLHAIERSSALDAALASVRPLFQEWLRTPMRPSLPARLIFDSRTTLAPSFARGEHDETFQQLYSTAEHNIELWLERLSKGRWYLIGQVLPKHDGNAIAPETVSLISADGSALTTVSFGSEFHAPSVAEGVYQLHLRLRDAEIIVPDVHLGA